MRLLLIAACLALAACATPSQAQPAHTMPEWWIAHVDFISRDGGLWVAPNPANEDDDANQPDAFAMHWRAENGDHVLVGRLYGLEDGQETQTFWTFREFWHPGERKAYLHQWGGDGIYGVGEVTMQGNRSELVQIFWLPDGRAWRDGHRTLEDGDTYVTDQFLIDDAGTWTPNGGYVWRRVRG
jgi:hypothetical protein